MPSRDHPLTTRIAALYEDAELCARAAGLNYVTDEESGIHRRASGRGFAYRDAAGRPITDGVGKQRITDLAVPPAWRDVWISPDPDGHILAVGADDRGRRQYIYHERWRALRDRLNFYRLIEFGEHLPALRDHVQRQLRRRLLDRDRVLAAMIRIVDTSAIRIGSEVYAEENESFGLTTLTRRHVSVHGAVVHLRFRAKSGRAADLTLTDRPLAHVVDALARQRRRRLFTVDGRVVDAADVNELLLELTGVHVTAKDFRTWSGTLSAFTLLEQHRDADNREHLAVEAVDAAAETLGNTRAVARAHYVPPQLLGTFVDGSFPELLDAARPRRRSGLTGAEQRLLAFLTNLLAADRAISGALGPAKAPA